MSWYPAPRIEKRNKRDKERELLEAYGDPTKPGSLGGASRFARIHRLKAFRSSKGSRKRFGLHAPSTETMRKISHLTRIGVW